MTHIGISPKAFQQIHRFQKLSNFLLYNKINLNLTELSYDYHYYDQTHFIKDFKHFSGTTPSQFLKDSRTIKEVSQLHL